MRKYIAEQMNKGTSLEDIHIQVEKMFNEEYKSREEKQLRLQQAAKLDRATLAVVDYLNSYIGEEVLTVENCKDALRSTAEKIKFMKKISDSFVIESDEDEDAERLANFLVNLGLIK